MRNIIIKLFIAGFLFLLCNTNLLAQDSSNVDAGLEGDSLTVTESLGDTVLSRSQFETDDSMQAYKKDKEFAYIKYLDSLLRKTKDLTVDTFSVTGGSSRGRNQIPQKSRRINMPVNIFSQPVVKIILWILAVFLIGFITWKLFLGENYFKRNRTYKSNADMHKDDEGLADASAYDKLIALAIMNKNYRLAIRYLYLQTLHKLADIGLLQFSADKTNYQYVSELDGKPYQNEFASMTLNYEYVWYGKFDISEEVYRQLAGEYKSFHQKV